MADMTFTPKLAIYKVEGSIAALVKEEVWEKLLKGEVIGVMEPDPVKYTLFINGQFVKTIKADTETRLNIKAERAVLSWQKSEKFAKRTGAIQSLEVTPGYPNMIQLGQEKIEQYLVHGLNARICSEKIREFVKKSCGKIDSFAGVYTFMEEISNGMTREGRD